MQFEKIKETYYTYILYII